ncbi:MAG: hypothetical protein Q9165_008055 [Trypethelium subeluteriae]
MTSQIVQKDCEQYTIGWIAALALERAAATAILDEHHQIPADFEPPCSDSNVYTWGRIGEHNVVIASLAAGGYGTVSAATTAIPMLACFPHIRFGLLVGIGGGIARPNEGRDIRLGDVVVSQPTGTSGGVVQYDFGKFKAGHGPERIGSLRKPPEAMLKALAKLQADHELADSQVPQILEAMGQSYPNMMRSKPGKPSYQYQGTEHDHLFRSTYNHIGGADCSKCDLAQSIQRDQRFSLGPEIHYGVVASGNWLIKEVPVRDEIIEFTGEDCLCLEMEAAGLMDSFPCIVIRGISDYADSHKNDRWQRYAAATAAAFAKELLSYIPVHELSQTPKVIENQDIRECLNQIDQRITELVPNITSVKNHTNQLVLDAQQQKVMEWLSSSDSSINQNKARQLHQQGTGTWFLKSNDFINWKSYPHSFLWLNGFPGSGKTILSSTIITALEKDTTSSQWLLYFYFDFSDPRKQSHDSMVRSLIHQLYYRSEITRKELNLLFSSSENGHRQPATESLCKVFTNSIEHSDQIWIVLDALDECETRKGGQYTSLLPWIRSLIKARLDHVHLLVTSRPEHDIEKAFQYLASTDSIIHLESKLVSDDISTYVHARVRDHDGLERWRGRPDIQDEIEKELRERANGMFRWVACQLDVLEGCTDLRMLRKAIASLPETLDETYSRILDLIPPYHKDNMIRILQFLVYSERPLRLEEAVDAIIVEPEHEDMFQPGNRMPQPEEIKLIVREIRESYPFAEYCAKYWMTHAVDDKDDRVFKRLLIRFFLEEHGSFVSCCLLYNPDRSWDKEPSKKMIPHKLYYASFVGLKSAVKLLLQTGADINAQGGIYGNALQAASLGGYTELVQLLLDKGANIHAQGGEYSNALQAASSRGYTAIVQLLLDKGADINAQGGR